MNHAEKVKAAGDAPDTYVKLKVVPTLEMLERLGLTENRLYPPEFFLSRPIHRALETWASTGLSPVGLAGLLRIPPRDVLEQAKLEGGLDVGFCSETFLPIIAESYCFEPFYNHFDEEVADWLDNFDPDPDLWDSWDSLDELERVKKAVSKFAHTTESFLERFGKPRTWQRYAKARFDPYDRGCGIGPGMWSRLERAVWLEGVS